MHIITSQILFEKYPGHEDDLHVLLNKLSNTITILPICDYLATKQLSDSINDSILIIGNDDVVPFGQIANPASDNDAMVLSDAPYACINDHTYLIPDKVIARIPDEALNPSWDYLSTVLNHQINWTNNKTINNGWFHIVAQVWQAIGQFIHNQFNMDEFNVSPGITYQNLHVQQINRKISYINLHGTSANGNFYNQSGNSFGVALVPQQGNFDNTLVFTEACYSGYILKRNKEISIPMMALYSNAVGVICSTTIAYGPSGPPAMAMDLFAECLFKQVLSGVNLGTALLNAKKDFATQTIKQYGSMDSAARKTLLQIVLFANPEIIL